VNETWTTFSRWTTDPAAGAASQPTLSVSGRADGGGYTVTAGARALTITAQAGATLLTTVTDQDGSSVSVTDSTTSTPSWTAPAGGTTGSDVCVMVTATLAGLTEQVGWSELVDGSGGGSYTVTPPADTTDPQPAGSPVGAKTFGAFGGADAGSIDGYTARTVNAVGATSWSGSGLGAYTPSGGADGDAGVLALDATIGGVVVATALHDYSRAAAAGGETVIYSLDLTTGVTDHTFTKGGGDEQVYEADGTTPKFIGGLVERLGTATGGARVTAAAGGLNVDCSGATRALDAYIKLTESETGVDWSDRSKTYAVDYLVIDVDVSTNNDAITVQASTVTSIAGTGFGVQFRRVGGSNYWDRGRRYVGSGQVGANQNNQTTLVTTRSVRIIIEGGTKSTVYWTEGTAFLSGVPTPSATVWKSATGCEAIGMEASPEETFGDPFYVNFEALSFGAGVTQGTLTKMQISEI